MQKWRKGGGEFIVEVEMLFWVSCVIHQKALGKQFIIVLYW